MGDPLLNRVADSVVELDTPHLHQLIEDMRDTMESLDGAGIAAPQIGVSQQVVIFGAKPSSRYPEVEQVPETVLINPVIEVLNNQTAGMWEGCLSVPGMRGYVERPSYVRYIGKDQFGTVIDRTVDGFHAIVVQHECDHLNGVLFPMRITDMRKFGFTTELDQMVKSV